MSRADRIIPAAEAGVLAQLSRLARKGAYAVPPETEPGDSRGQHAVFSPRNGFARPIGAIPEGTVAYACRQGWLEEEPGHGERLRLTPAGARALRRVRSGVGSAPPGGKGDRDGKEPGLTRRPTAVSGAGKRESPLAWLRRRKDKGGRPLISEAQFSAGERLATDYWRAQLTQRVTADWSATATSRRERRGVPGAGIELADSVVAAREWVARALRAVGPELAGILVDVCCLEMGLQAAGREQAWPQRATRIVLDLALKSLARHYGLIPREPPPGATRLRHWGEEGYRPTLDAWQG
jgi:hypothetical protein